MPQMAGVCGFVPRRMIYIVLFLLCLAAYRGILDNRLFNDDFSWLKAARHDMTPANLFTFRVVDFFRPLVNLSFYLMEMFWPGNIPVHYGFNLLLHILCTILVFRLILRLLENERLAATAAALFAVTSVHSAAVMWISARTTLLASCLLLASLNVLFAGAGTRRLRLAASIALYVLALASKEEAIAGLLLVALLFALKGKGAPSAGPGRNALAAFAVVSIVYLVMRQTVMAGILRENWGPGAHALRNVAGGFLFQLYPWPFFSLFYPRGNYIPEPSGALGPELAAIPIALALVAAGYASKKSHAMNLAVGWSLLALLPVSFFRYRFFSTVSISQDRYYYLSSVGTVIVIVLLLSMLWKEHSPARQGAAIALFVILCAGSLVRDARLEKKWDDFTKMYRETVVPIIEESDAFPGFTKLIIEGSPLAFPYLNDAIALERPGRTAIEVTGGKDSAQRYAPCLYISYTGEEPILVRVMRLK